MGFPAPPRLTAESAETAEPRFRPPCCFCSCPRENKKTMGGDGGSADSAYSVVELGGVVRPYFAHVGKRLVKTPKVYFTDTGTLCYLAGLRDAEHAAAGPMGGAIMETAVLSEILKTLVHQGKEPQVHFWRTSAGSEVDFVVDTGEKLIPIEVKLSATPRAAMASGIRAFLFAKT